MMSAADETLDSLGLSRLQLIQARQGYRFSIDPVLLCGFCAGKDEALVVDLGSGNGVVPLLMAAGTSAGRIVGIERQAQMG